MAVVRILQYPDPRLRTVGETVENVQAPEVQHMIADMLETLEATENCGGLASTQMDFEHPKQITVIYASEKSKKPICLINPTIIAQEGRVNEPEGCMSIGGNTFVRVKRAEKITVRYLTPQGKTVEKTHDGYIARCIQHEIDHLNGVLSVDYVSKLKLARIRSKILKAQRR